MLPETQCNEALVVKGATDFSIAAIMGRQTVCIDSPEKSSSKLQPTLSTCPSIYLSLSLTLAHIVDAKFFQFFIYWKLWFFCAANQKHRNTSTRQKTRKKWLNGEQQTMKSSPTANCCFRCYSGGSHIYFFCSTPSDISLPAQNFMFFSSSSFVVQLLKARIGRTENRLSRMCWHIIANFSWAPKFINGEKNRVFYVNQFE